MRVPIGERTVVVSTIGAGCAVLLAALVQAASMPLATLALLCAAATLSEYFQVESSDGFVDGGGARIFSFSSGIHLAAVIIAGPWAAALAAAFGVVVVDRLAGKEWRRVGFNASVFVLAALGGGIAFSVTGGDPGVLELPGDLLPLAGLAVTYSVLNTALVALVTAVSAGTSVWALVREWAPGDVASDLAEAGLGGALAFFALRDPWAIVLLGPLAFAAYQAHARLAQLRRETAQALESFANVVDERDPYTFRHSKRVSEYVGELAEALRLPALEVARLRWAGRVHDLGKIAVDASVLLKPSALSAAEFEDMRRHPRLSARMLRRFRFAREEARAVEYHHERFDGRGYYGIAASELPLAAHFLTVADSFDAMTSDRPYRQGMSVQRALDEIERGSGTQFHPAVARAFVALRRGEDPLSLLARAEIAELRGLSLRPRRDWPAALAERHREFAVLAGTVGALVAVGLGSAVLALALAASATLALAGHVRAGLRGRKLAAALADAALDAEDCEDAFRAVVGRLAADTELRWAGIVSWREQALDGTLEREWTAVSTGPSEAALKSWLMRDADAAADLLVEAGPELGSDGEHAAVPLRADDRLNGFLVLAFRRGVPRTARSALAAFPTAAAQRLAPVDVEQPALRAAG
jgi:putative nucleotidyltransferase with HDIG domain